MENETVFVLLAGGKSERMGVAKGLLKFGKTFWILEQLHRISKTEISTVFIGLGFNHQQYFEAIPWLSNARNKFVKFQNLKVKITINPNPKLGSFSTLQTVLNAFDSKYNIVINPIDVPILNSSELRKICTTQNTVVIPAFEGKKGHPIKISTEFCSHLSTVDSSDKNARLDFQIKRLNSTHISIIAVDDSAILKNLNTQTEWSSFIKES